MKRIFWGLAFLYFLPLHAMDDEVSPWQRILSQEITDAVTTGDVPNREIIKTWREHYNQLMSGKATKEIVNNFFAPIAEQIYSNYEQQYNHETNKSVDYVVKFYHFVDESWQAYHEAELKFSNTQGDKFISVGRHHANTIILPQGHLQISRLHLIMTKLPNGSGLLLDPFSSCGSETLERKNDANFKNFKLAQAHDNKLFTQNKREIFVSEFSSKEPLFMRIGIDLMEIRAKDHSGS